VIFIWGSTGLSSTLSTGRFYCPRCDRPDVGYELKSTRRWFTFFFIPCFPISGTTRYVECRRCGQAFDERVLDLEPPEDDGPTREEVDDCLDELDRGASVEVTAGRLEKLGLSPKETDRLLDNHTQGKVWQCERCDRHYVERVRPCPKCG
jgi:hypothetical protein